MKKHKIVNKTILTILILLLFASLLMVYASCGSKLNGVYASIYEDDEDPFMTGSGFYYIFKGNTVTLKVYALGMMLNNDKATYRINGDTITFISDTASVYLARVYDYSTGKYTSTYDFEMGDDYIKIGDIVCTKYTDELPE